MYARNFLQCDWDSSVSGNLSDGMDSIQNTPVDNCRSYDNFDKVSSYAFLSVQILSLNDRTMQATIQSWYGMSRNHD
jgi:hypothetical protein